MTEYDITFVLTPSDEDTPTDAFWLTDTAEKLMDYFLGSGHDIVASTNASQMRMELELTAFEAQSDREALRIASELLGTAGSFAGIEIFLDPKERTKRKDGPASLSKRSALVSSQ